MKNGIPIIDVTIPIGISLAKQLRHTLSTISKYKAPNKVEKSIILRLSCPTIILAIWGIIMPTQPIIPPTATQCRHEY